MKNKPHTYEGAKISVTFDLQRCIHAAECVKGLPEVFDPNRKPWVDPNAAEPERLLEVVSRCPSGALKARSVDGTQSAYNQVQHLDVAGPAADAGVRPTSPAWHDGGIN